MRKITEKTLKNGQKKYLFSTDDSIKSVCVLQFGNNESSNRYVKNKLKDCEEVGIQTVLLKVSDGLSVYRTAEISKYCFADATGVIIQMPLPESVDKEEIINHVLTPRQDVDGFCKDGKVNPATPQGIMTYLKDQNYNLTNKNVIIIGRSDLVGKPLAQMMLKENANVTLLHSKTSKENLRLCLQNADIVVCATGHRNTLTNEDFAQNAFKPDLVFDVGINFNDEGKLVGDCENLTYCEKTPVPNGVGLLTRLAVIENLIKLAKN